MVLKNSVSLVPPLNIIMQKLSNNFSLFIFSFTPAYFSLRFDYPHVRGGNVHKKFGEYLNSEDVLGC